MRTNQSGFTLVEMLLVGLIIGLMATGVFIYNANISLSLVHGVKSTLVASNAEVVRRGMQSISQQSTEIWVTPAFPWNTGPFQSSTKNSIEEVTAADVKLCHEYFNSTYEDEGSDYAYADSDPGSLPSGITLGEAYSPTYLNDEDNATSIYQEGTYNPDISSGGIIIWFNAKTNTSADQLKGIVIVTPLGSTTVGSMTELPRNVLNKDSVRVLFFAEENMWGSLDDVQDLIEVADDLCNETVSSETTGPDKLIFPAIYPRNPPLVAAYVVDYDISFPAAAYNLESSEYQKQYAAHRAGLNALSITPAIWTVRHCVSRYAGHNYAYRVKLPHPYDYNAVRVPQTFGITSPVITEQSLQITNAAHFTIYAYIPNY